MNTAHVMNVIAALHVYIVEWFRARVHSRADAEDLAQQTMLRAIVSVKAGTLVIHPGVNVDAAVKRWLHGVARHVLAEWFKRPWLREVSDDDAEPEPYDALPQLEAREELRRVVARIRRNKRRIMVAVAEGYTADEVARMQGVPAGTVASTVRRSRVFLRKWTEQGNTESV